MATRLKRKIYQVTGENTVRRIGLFLIAVFATLSIATLNLQAQTVLTRHVHDAVLNGKAQLLGPLSSGQVMSLDIVLPLRNQADLDSLLQQLYDPSSASYRQFLTVDEFTEQFGPTQQDYESVVNWALANGLTVSGSAPNRLTVHVTGTVANIQSALHVRMNSYQHPTENRAFFSADREPTADLPISLWHVAGLDNYSIPHPAGLSRNAKPAATPHATTGSGPSASFLGSDMRGAYYGGTLTGQGQSLGLLEYYGTDLADLTTYFTNAKQTNNVPITLLSTDGTSTSCVYPSCDDTEQTLDMTQAIGMAPGLSSLVVYVGSSDAAIFNAMATHSPLASQLSSSWTWYPADPSTDNPYFEEFAAQGQNLFQAAGDGGKWTTSGSASEIFPADDIYVTAVGGTDLNTSSAGGAWSSETAWSDSGGGISPHDYAIPSWQTAAAASCASCSKTYRNGPDVSANANFTFYVCADQTTCTANEYGGTSFATPMWAGYLALVNQQAKLNGATKGIGFINPSLYTIGLGSSYHSDFHDITSGSNGYSATAGYDLATGWGSPNGSGLITALAGSSSPTPSFSLSASQSSVSVVQGKTGTSSITSAVANGFDAAVTLSASGAPTGVTVSFSSNPIAAPGSGSSTATFTVGSTTATGTYSITITGSGGGLTETTSVSLTVTAAATPAFTISASPASVSVVAGNSGTSTITTSVSGGFTSAIGLTASGQPSGVTVGFSPSSIASPGSGTSTATFTVGSTAAAGTYTITVTGTGGGITHTATGSLTVTKPANAAFTVSVSPSSGSLDQGQSGYAVVTTTVSGGFNSAITLSATGLPSGVIGSFSPNPINAPGSGTSDFTLTVSRTAPTGTHTITITATGGGITHTTTLTFTVLR
jgi:subtilase family serine protease